MAKPQNVNAGLSRGEVQSKLPILFTPTAAPRGVKPLSFVSRDKILKGVMIYGAERILTKTGGQFVGVCVARENGITRENGIMIFNLNRELVQTVYANMKDALLTKAIGVSVNGLQVYAEGNPAIAKTPGLGAVYAPYGESYKLVCIVSSSIPLTGAFLAQGSHSKVLQVTGFKKDRCYAFACTFKTKDVDPRDVAYVIAEYGAAEKGSLLIFDLSGQLIGKLKEKDHPGLFSLTGLSVIDRNCLEASLRYPKDLARDKLFGVVFHGTGAALRLSEVASGINPSWGPFRNDDITPVFGRNRG